MKTLRIFFSLLVAISFHHEAPCQESPLIPLQMGDCWGYVSATGEVKIEPNFFVANAESEGLYAVREHGVYGYINREGEYVIEAKYDFAQDFRDGVALVSLDAKPYFIDREGEILFEHEYEGLQEFNHEGVAIAKIKDDQYQLINKKGKKVTDRHYPKIKSFENGWFAATIENEVPSLVEKSEFELPRYQSFIFNEKGEQVFDNWRISNIHYLDETHFQVTCSSNRKSTEPNSEDDSITGYLRTDGKFIAHEIDETNGRLAGHSDGFYIYREWSKPQEIYLIVDDQQKMVVKESELEGITVPNQGVYFAEKSRNEWYLLNINGDTISPNPYLEIGLRGWDDFSAPFQSDFEMVLTKEGWIAIDRAGNQINNSEPIEGDLYHSFNQESYLIREILNEELSFPERYGFRMFNPKSGLVGKTWFQGIGVVRNYPNLFYAKKDDFYGLVDERGNWLVKQKEIDSQIETWNIDFQKYTSYYVSEATEDPRSSLHAINSENSETKKTYLEDFSKLSFRLADTDDGLRLILENQSELPASFTSMDSCPYITMQAQNKLGEWVNIEERLNSWCGNSYYSIILKPKEKWDFIIPKYEGSFSTKLRMKIVAGYDYDSETEVSTPVGVLYSEVFEGSINPGQFWRTQDYYPMGIMDPYFNVSIAYHSIPIRNSATFPTRSTTVMCKS